MVDKNRIRPHLILVAFAIEGDDEKTRQEKLMNAIDPVLVNSDDVFMWWVAEDERYDDSAEKYDSAIFVPRGQQDAAKALLVQLP